MSDLTKDKLFSSNEFKKKLYERIHGISSSFKINYAINPKLKYEYPPINPIIIENIVNCLISSPKFYTQTLHLMNKMNLPCPLVPYVRVQRAPMGNEQTAETISTNNQTSQLGNSNTQDLLASSQQNPVDMSTSESESEIESDTEPNRLSNKPLKHTSSMASDVVAKKVKLKSLMKTVPLNVDKSSTAKSIEEVFEKPKSTKLPGGKLIMPSRIEALPTQTNLNEEVGLISCSVSQEMEVSSTGEFITLEQLEKGRMKLSELKELPVFKNYDKGEPSPKLYLKNLSKKLQESDLKYIFGRYINWNSQEELKSFDIKLMKEGRMKGQAFITFPNEKLADKALNETIGYLFDDKPMIIQFARAAKS